MSAELLLHSFERVVETAGGLPRLRRFILDLAARGKLVPQDAADGSATDLLAEIAVHNSVVRSRRNGHRDDLSPVTGLEEPFALPASWVWVRLGAVLAKLTDGTHHSPPNVARGPYRYITAKNVKHDGIDLDAITYVTADVHAEIYARCNPEPGDVLYIKDGATTGVVTINNLAEPFSMLSSVALLKLPPGLYNRLLVTFLRAPFFYDQMRGQMKGSALPRVTLTRMAPALVPLPPLAEQHRIVTKVDELMALCDELEAAQIDREARRDQLRSTSLRNLLVSGKVKEHAKFFVTQSPRMITKPEHVGGLRQVILDLAVQGRLIQQSLADEPIRPAMDAVLARRAVLVGSKAVRKKNLDGRGSLLRGGDLPDSWTTESLGNLVDPENTISYGVLVPGDHLPGGVPLVRAQDLSISAPAARPNKSIAPDIERAYARTRLHGGEILVCVVGSIGKLGVAPASWAGANIARAIARIDPVPEVSRAYLLIALRTSMVQNYFQTTTRTLAQPTLNVGLIELTPIPLPPRAEQDRIVAKVDELMAVCDGLERSLATEQTERARLLEALLHDAVEDAAPARETNLSAAVVAAPVVWPLTSE